MDKEKLHQYALNQLSEKKETENVINWLEASPENQEEFNTLKNLWAISGFANYDTYLNNERVKTDRTRHLKFSPYGLLKYASILVLAFLIGGGSFYYLFKPKISYNEVIVPAGESAEVILPDNSHVWLNSGSKIIYPTSFVNKTRDIEFEGEAYFEVTHNSKKTFQVITSNLTIEVLGTSFNVEAYSQTNNINVTLVEGKVKLKSPEGNDVAELSPSENATFNLEDKKLDITDVNVDYFTSWKNGFLLFEDETLDNIAAKLEVWYNVDMIFENEGMKSIEFTGTILKNKPIDQILNVLKYTSNFDYSIEMKNNKPSVIYLKSMPMK